MRADFFYFRDDFEAELVELAPAAELIKYLHVPIDDTILEEACKNFKLEKPDRGWSQMNKNTYMAFQQKLKDKIMANSNPPYGEEDGRIPFYWELMVWSKPKN